MKLIHVEASTYCNARCPLCPRSLYGLKIEGVYPEVHLTLDRFKKCLQQYPDREYVYFNGNLGDPMMNPAILDLASVTNCKTGVTTNGSIGSEHTWKRMAEIGVEVTFSIDGMADTNHIYRQDVEWEKVMQRVKWFITTGGTAKWKFVVFKHNAHQRIQAEKLANDLGFQEFSTEDHGRNFGPALDKQGNITHWILPEDGSREPEHYDVKAGVERYKKTHYNFKLDKKKYEIDCEHERDASVYIDAHGRIAPCCYQGFDLPELPFRNISEFAKLKATWHTTSCDPVCAQSCNKLT